MTKYRMRRGFEKILAREQLPYIYGTATGKATEGKKQRAEMPISPSSFSPARFRSPSCRSSDKRVTAYLADFRGWPNGSGWPVGSTILKHRSMLE